MTLKEPAEKAVRDIRRKTRRQCPAEEKIRIVLDGSRGEEGIASPCRRGGIADHAVARMVAIARMLYQATLKFRFRLWGLRCLLRP